MKKNLLCNFMPDADAVASVVIPSPAMAGAAVTTFTAALSRTLLLLDLGILPVFLGFTGSWISVSLLFRLLSTLMTGVSCTSIAFSSFPGTKKGKSKTINRLLNRLFL